MNGKRSTLAGFVRMLLLVTTLSWSAVVVDHAQAAPPGSSEGEEANRIAQDAFTRGSWRSLPAPQLKHQSISPILSSLDCTTTCWAG